MARLVSIRLNFKRAAAYGEVGEISFSIFLTGVSPIYILPPPPPSLSHDSRTHYSLFPRRLIGMLRRMLCFTFQLIWNMKTNVFTDEEAQHKDPEIGAHLENLIDRISKSLSGTALDFFKREFDFFDKVTSISGTIRYRTGPSCLGRFTIE